MRILGINKVHTIYTCLSSFGSVPWASAKANTVAVNSDINAQPDLQFFYYTKDVESPIMQWVTMPAPSLLFSGLTFEEFRRKDNGSKKTNANMRAKLLLLKKMVTGLIVEIVNEKQRKIFGKIDAKYRLKITHLVCSLVYTFNR